MRNKLFLATMVSLALSGCNDETISVGGPTPTNTAPSVLDIENQTIKISQSTSIAIEAKDLDGDKLFFAINGSPDWVHLSEDGVISLTPTSDAAINGLETVYAVTAVVSDNTVSREQTFAVTILPKGVSTPSIDAPVIAAIPQQFIRLGENKPLEIQISAERRTGEKQGGAFIYELIQAPDWVSIDINSGLISLSPDIDSAGPYQLIAKVSDATKGYAARAVAFNLIITEVTSSASEDNIKPSIANIADFSLIAGSTHNLKVSASDPDGDVPLYSMMDSPSWVFINANGNMSFLPQSNDVSETAHSVTVRVSDGLLSETETFNVTVNPKTSIDPEHLNQAPVIAAITKQSIKADTHRVLQVQATDKDGDHLTYTLAKNSSWGEINESGEITLTPSTKDVGDHNVIVQVSDGSVTSEMAFSVEVTPINWIPVNPDNANHAPVIKPIAAQSIEHGTVLSLQVEATDKNGDALSYTLANASALSWVNLDENGELSLSPTIANIGEHDISVQVSDGSLTSTMTFSVDVVLFHTDLEPPTTATYQGKLVVEGKVLTNSLDSSGSNIGSITCDGQALDTAGQFSFTVQNGDKSIQCNFGSLSNLVTVRFSFSDLLGKNGEPEQIYVRNFDIKTDGDLASHYNDAAKLLSYISTCPTETSKLCLDEIDSYDLIDLYRTGKTEAIDAFVNPVVAEEGEQPSSHVDPGLKPEVTPGAGTDLGDDFVSANAEAAYEYIPSLESKPLTSSRLLDSNDNPMVGIEYFSQSVKGRTNSEGEFDYLWGENLVFGIDTFTLGEVKGNKLEYRLVDLSENEQTQLNIQTLVNRYDIGRNEVSSEKVRLVFSQYPNVINELINLTLPNGAINQECIDAKLPEEMCKTPDEFINQFTQGLTQLIDNALEPSQDVQQWHAPRLLRADTNTGAYVSNSLQQIFKDVDNIHIFHDNVTFYGASGYARAMRNFNITNEAFPVLMPRNDNNFWLPFGTEAAWSRGAGVDKKAYFVDATLLDGESSVIMKRPDPINKETATYNMPSMAAGLIGQGKVVFLGNIMYTSPLSCPDNFWAYGELKIDPSNKVCNYQSEHNEVAERYDSRNDRGSMQTFYKNLFTWLTPAYANGKEAINIGTNLTKGYTLGYSGGYEFFIDSSYNIDQVSQFGPYGFGRLDPNITPILLLQSFDIKMFGDGQTNKLLSDVTSPSLSEDDVTHLINYVNAGGNIIFFDTLETQNPAPIARLADAAGVSIGGANVARTLQAYCGESYYCQNPKPNLHAVHQHDIVVYERYPNIGGGDGVGLKVDPTTSTGTVVWPSDEAMLENTLEIAKYDFTTTDEEGVTTTVEKPAFHIVKDEKEKEAAIAEIQAGFPDANIPLCKDDYPYEVNCIEVRPGHGIPSRGSYGRPDFQRFPMSPDVVSSMVKAANLGGNFDKLLSHELYFRTEGEQGARLSKAELTATYDNLSVWMWNNTKYEYAEDSEAGDELGFKRAVEILNCYTNDQHGGNSACNDTTRKLLQDPDNDPATDDGMLNAIGELDPQFPLNWMEKPLTRIMLGRSFWDYNITVDTDGYLPRPTASGSSETAIIHTQGKKVVGTAGNMQSTGLWAPQLQNVTVSGGVKATITVALVDDITGRTQHELALKRPSRVQKSFSHDGVSTTFEVPYGGLIYVRPHTTTESDTAAFSFTNVVKGSLWKDGNWLHYNPDVPLAEIDTGHFIYTTPVNNTNGTDIQKFVDEMNLFAEGASDFYGRDETPDLNASELGQHRRFTYDGLPGHHHRFVNDAQITIGAAHSGYPVQSSSFNVDRDTIPTAPTNDWLLWHEVGHNLASAPFALVGSTEVTNNILALYMQEKREGDLAYMDRLESTMQKVTPWTTRHDGHAWSEGDNAMRLVFFGQLKLWAEDHFNIDTVYSDAASRPTVFGNDQGWNLFKLAHRKAREGGVSNYCSTASGLDQGDLLMACLSQLSGYDLSDYFKVWNPSEAKADLPEGGVTYNGGLTDAGFSAVTSLKLSKPDKLPSDYITVK
ncbi:SslE/AcfD family lipoprotein zinc metalloprotease [Vibrio renipiscarius]|uniref:SslE/AcfD family lipoprotein zinc metalloprotease n=1 Tax=Vibrio renipiscarius TaxID=1461322 RepID=UPI0035519DAC